MSFACDNSIPIAIDAEPFEWTLKWEIVEMQPKISNETKTKSKWENTIKSLQWRCWIICSVDKWQLQLKNEEQHSQSTFSSRFFFVQSIEKPKSGNAPAPPLWFGIGSAFESKMKLKKKEKMLRFPQNDCANQEDFSLSFLLLLCCIFSCSAHRSETLRMEF